MTHPKSFAHTSRFYGLFGQFHAVWSATELNIDWAIGKLKKISPKEAHALAAKLKFSDKMKTLRALLRKREYENATEEAALDGDEIGALCAW